MRVKRKKDNTILLVAYHKRNLVQIRNHCENVTVIWYHSGRIMKVWDHERV
jgi:hypothetical protein